MLRATIITFEDYHYNDAFFVTVNARSLLGWCLRHDIFRKFDRVSFLFSLEELMLSSRDDTFCRAILKMYFTIEFQPVRHAGAHFRL